MGWLDEGAAVEVVCQVKGGQDLDHGGTLDWQRSHTWDKLRDGRFLYDHFVNTPDQGRDGFSPGVPQCGSSSTNSPTSLDLNRYPQLGRENDGHGYPDGQCTSFAAWAIHSDRRPHSKFPDNLGNAKDWRGVSSSSAPHVGDIAQWAANHNGAYGAGHVAYVAAVNNDGTITIYESNWPEGHGPSSRTIKADVPSRYLQF